MKMRIIKLTPEFLKAALQGKAGSAIANLPDDSELLEIKYDHFANQVLAVVRSDSFEDVAESMPVPEFSLAFTSASKEQKPAPKQLLPEPTTLPSAKQTTQPAKPEATQTKKSTSSLEGEFTPEQRKLLSFKVQGDCVIVKPTQFLKAEWNDINDVSKSLGGRWVKGDIISYWEIPLQQS